MYTINNGGTDSLVKRFEVKFNESVIQCALESANELYTHLQQNPHQYWNNSQNPSEWFEIYIYNCGDGTINYIKTTTNVCIKFTLTNFNNINGFSVIDIFDNKVSLCSGVGLVSLDTIDLDHNATIDDGYIFQLQTLHEIMPFSTEHMKLIHLIASRLESEEDSEY